jgi:flagellar hook-associated protein 1
MDAFYSGWSELGTNPANATVRSVVRQTGNVLTQRFGELSDGVASIRTEVETRLVDAATQATALGAEVARLNTQIVTIEADGNTAGDLRDTRSRALARLADLLPTQVTERDNGSVGVNSSGIGIVDGAYSLDLEVTTSGGTVGLGAVGRAGFFPQVGGRIGGLLTVINTDLPDVQQRLDDLAAAMVADVNGLHETGTNPDGNTGVSFFDPAGTTATTIALSSDVLASTTAIAAGTPDGLGAYRAGANDVALALGGLRDTDSASLSMTMGEQYRGLVSDIGQAVRSSSDAAEAHRVLAEQADIRRMSLSGVSIDEELVKMIEFQTAYQASARVVSVADELMQALLAV